MFYTTGLLTRQILRHRHFWINRHLLFSCSHQNMDQTKDMQTVSDDNKFLYFAYGSNLLSARIHIQNPSAVFKTIARLDDYQLDFDYGGPSSTWLGAAATVTSSPGDHVWGVLWSMDKADLPSLDTQEGVQEGVYEAIEVVVTRQDGRPVKCRTYNLLKRGSEDRRPSPQYKEIIVLGAIQHQLPQEYIARLNTIKHNEFQGSIPLYETVMSNHRTTAL